MNDFWFQLEMFNREREWLRAEAVKVVRLPKSEFRSRRIDEITLRYLHVAREFNRFMEKHAKGKS